MRGEDIDTRNNQHIVGTAINFIHLDQCSSTGTLFAAQARDVLGAIADHGHGTALQRRKNELAFFAHGQGFQGDRIDDLGQKVVFIDMQSILNFTIE